MQVDEVIARTFAEVLDAEEDVRVGSDFFDVGGDSILAARVIARLRRTLDVRLSVRDLFTARTPTALAEVVERRRAAAV